MTVASPKVQTGELRERLAKSNLAFFAAEYLGLELGQHHLRWSEIVHKYKMFDILAARGHGKSGFFSYAYIAWQCWRTSRNRGLFISNVSDQVEEFFRILKQGVEFKDETGYTWRMPALIDTELAPIVPTNFERSWTGSSIQFQNGSRVTGKSIGSEFRGRHVPWIMIDDPHSDAAAVSEVVRMKEIDFIKTKVEPMLLRGGQIGIIGTPLHGEDIHGQNAKNPEWHFEAFPAVSPGPNGSEVLLWEEFRPRKYLIQRKRSMGTLRFNQEFMLRAASSEASIFPPMLFLERPETMAGWLRLRPAAHEMRARSSWSYYAGIDLAMSATVGADYTVVFVVGVDEHWNRHTVEIVRSKGLPFHVQLKLIEDTLRPYQASGSLVAACIESNQAQRAWGDELIRKTDLPIVKHTTGVEKNDLAKGVPSLRILFENGKYRLARGDARSVELTDVFRAELQAFAWVNGRLEGVGSHDDLVMAAWLCDLAVRGGDGMLFISSEDPIDDDEAVLGGAPAPDFDAPPAVTEQARAELPWIPGGEVGKAAMIRQGYVPETCTLDPLIAAPLIWQEINASRSPCWGCEADRNVCHGQPKRHQDQSRLLPSREAQVGPDEARREPRRREAAPPALRTWVDTVEACKGDEDLARLIPQGRQERGLGWNAMMGGGSRPAWVSQAQAAGKIDALYDALSVLLGVGTAAG